MRQRFTARGAVLTSHSPNLAAPGSAHEQRLSTFLQDYRSARSDGAGRLRCLLASPRATLTAASDFLRLPKLALHLNASPEGIAIRRAIRPALSPRRVLPHAAVLALPSTSEDYMLGPSKQTLRRKVRQSRRLGVTWRRVDDPRERWELVHATNRWERNNPDASYRNTSPDNSDLPGYQLWLLACSADGRPLVLSVTPVDGEWAMLHYFRTIGRGIEQSLARYFLMTVLVDHLIPIGVRYLVNAGTPMRITNGLRHYQRMIGFRTYRLKVRTMHASKRRAEYVRAPSAEDAGDSSAVTVERRPAAEDLWLKGMLPCSTQSAIADGASQHRMPRVDDLLAR